MVFVQYKPFTPSVVLAKGTHALGKENPHPGEAGTLGSFIIKHANRPEGWHSGRPPSKVSRVEVQCCLFGVSVFPTWETSELACVWKVRASRWGRRCQGPRCGGGRQVPFDSAVWGEVLRREESLNRGPSIGPL